MKVRCTARKTADDHESFVWRSREVRLTVGREYLVLAVSFLVEFKFGPVSLVIIRNDDGDCSFYPMSLFEITDGRPSNFWLAQIWRAGSLNFAPLEFAPDHFFEDLADGDDKCRKALETVVDLMENEFGGRVEE